MEDDYEQRLLSLFDHKDYSKFSVQELLTNVFNHNGFKPNQLEIIHRIMNKEGNTLGIMPTGGGKSLCFQIPALLLPNMTLIISPLIALMKDQIDNLNKKGINSCFYINSSISEKAKDLIFDLIKDNKVKLLYVAPESLKSLRLLSLLEEKKIDLFVIDEAHCISSWGQDFRPDYLKIPEIISQLNNPPILALTATASNEIEIDIQVKLNIPMQVFKSSFDRPFLFMSIIPMNENIIKEQFLLNLLKKLSGSTIIYVTMTETAEQLSELLSKHGYRCTYYHGQIADKHNKEEKQNKFISGEYEIIIATIAFGMGIDKHNIRNIIHYNCSASIANYYQEIGRAGRDGNLAYCITLYSKNDIAKIKRLKEDSWPNKEKIEKVISYLKNKNSKYIFTSPRVIEYECELKEVPVKLILHRMEEFGAIKIYFRIPAEIKFDKFNINKQLEIIKQGGYYSNDLAKIFSSDFFSNSRKKWFLFEEVANELDMDYFRLKEIFEFLIKMNYITIIECKYKDIILKRSQLEHFDIIPLSELFNKILKKNLDDVDLLSNGLLTNRCIRKYILNYFGEEYHSENCEMCSNCVKNTFIDSIPVEIDLDYVSESELIFFKENLQIDIEHDDIKKTLLKAFIIDSPLPKKDLLKILTGDLNRSHSDWKFKLNCYDLFAKNLLNILKENLNLFLQNKYISERIDGSYRITKIGLEHLKKI